MSDRLRNIALEWTYPVRFDNSFSYERVYGKGIYYISCVHGKNERLLYIGQTSGSFLQRLKSHGRRWLGKYRGTKYVRFGILASPKNTGMDTGVLIKDIESALIFEMRGVLIHNTMCLRNYTYTYKCRIRNRRYRGMLPGVVDMRDHIPYEDGVHV